MPTSDSSFRLATSQSFLGTLVSFNNLYRRKVAAMGGMSAQIPVKGDEKANDIAMAKVRADKLREVTAGHDGAFKLFLAIIVLA